MPQVVKSDLLLHADITFPIFNKYFQTLCNWFISNKLSIHLGEIKTKSI